MVARETVRAVRAALELTVEKAAKRARVGVSTWERWERDGAPDQIIWLLIGLLSASGAPERVCAALVVRKNIERGAMQVEAL